MDEEEFKQNYEIRWNILRQKKERYGEAWRAYPIKLLMNLALHRLEEVVEVYKATGNFDLDNMIDAMNFCDMVIRRCPCEDIRKLLI